MPSKYWIKLYHEILDDPKMARLPDRLWRRAIEIFLLAGDCDKDGRLLPVDEMAWRLRVSVEELETDLADLASQGIVNKHDGQWIVTNFAKRQEASTNTERWRKFNERQHKNQYVANETNTNYETISNVSQTERLQTQNDLLRDTDIDIDTDTEEDKKEKEKKIRAPASDFSSAQVHTQDAARLYREVTGQPSIPSGKIDDVLYDLMNILDHYEGDIAKAIPEGKEVFADWVSTISQKTKLPYKATNPGWIQWWLEDLAPIPEGADPLDRYRQRYAEWENR